MANKNICFIANFSKTYFFLEIARVLEKKDINIYWIVTKHSQFEELKNEYGEGNVLLINRNNIHITSQPIGEFKINELLFGDRVWKYAKKDGRNFLLNIQKPIFNFIKSNDISFVFGEVTWAHELLIHRMVTENQELCCKYLSPHTIRIPNGRFAFFEDEKQSKILELNSRSVEEEIKEIRISKPDYLKVNDKILKKRMSLGGKLDRVYRYISGTNIEKNDPNVITNGLNRIRIPLLEEINRISYAKIKRISPSSLKDKKYVFYGFHKQPEASVDVSGRYYENQLECVYNLWRQLPNDWQLVVKEHSNAVGDRRKSFFKKIMELPNVILIDEKSDSYELIKNSQLVATNTGTMAYEAALMGIPAITFSNMFFNKLNFCRKISWSDLEEYGSLSTFLKEIKKCQDNKKEFTEFIYNNSFQGLISDVNSTPNVIDEDNIKPISNAFLKVICNV